MAAECYKATFVFVGQELEALRVLIWVQVLILFVEEDVVWLRQGMESLKDGVQWLRAFCAVENQQLLRAFDELRLPRFQDTRSARVLGFPGEQWIN